MSWTFYIVDASTFEDTDWQASQNWNVAPRLIDGGPNVGKYAVNVRLLDCSPIFEAYRDLLESMPTAVCGTDDRDVWFPPAPEE